MDTRLAPDPLRSDDGPLAPTLPRRRFTVSDVFAMQEAGVFSDGQFELLGGELVSTAAKKNDHEFAKSKLVRMLARRLSDDLVLGVESTLYLSEYEAPEPDIMIYPAQLALEDVRGPDVVLALEVAVESLRQDLGYKAALYASAGVPTYWVLDARVREIHVHDGPMPDGSWRRIQRFGASDPLPEVAGVLLGSLSSCLA